MLNAYVRALVRSPHLREDALSDVAIAIARSWATFDPSRPFGPWARAIARRVVFQALAKRNLKPLLLDEDALEALGAEIDTLEEESALELRVRALERCTEKLPEGSRELVRLRYFENQSYKQMAATVRWSVDALYVAFHKIHKALSECVHRQLEVFQG
jgi:RNA polymerase sigma-70 factor (ECF subfamily)